MHRSAARRRMSTIDIRRALTLVICDFAAACLCAVMSTVAYGGHESAHATQCPLDSDDNIKPGYIWSVTAAQSAVAKCTTRPIAVVRRKWADEWRKTCTPPSQNLSTAIDWASCAPPPACTADQEASKRAGGQARLQAWKQKCAGKKTVMPADNDPICTVPMLSYDAIVVHQTESAQTFGPDALQSAHLERGFDDIGYHYVIAKTRKGWRIFEGRSEAVEGAHAGSGLNGGAIGIAIAGDYRAQSNPGKEVSTLVPPPQAVMLLKSLIADIVARHPTIGAIYGHGEHKMKGSGCDTDCPSVGVQQVVNAVRREMFRSESQ